MIKPVNKNRPAAFVFDFQILKGKCSKTMRLYGTPVATAHEARLLVEDDALKLPAGENAIYAIHWRSENRILKIIETAVLPQMRRPKSKLPPAPRFPLAKAA
jgi:hypothetical protein